MSVQKRPVDIVILSDVHLGTVGCHASELLHYLKSIDPRILILNGDIFDMWNYRKSYFPKEHMKVIQRLIKMTTQGKQVYYITGNHDELLRQFSDMELSNFYLVDKLLLNIEGKRAWIFHGDVFDISMKYTKFLAKLGSIGYDLLILLNKQVNHLLKSIGKQPYSFSKRIKNSVKKAVQFVDDFEATAAKLAIDKGYDYVICGHIHQPKMKTVSTEKGSVLYLNSGDWVENLTALEYHRGNWEIYHYPQGVKAEEHADDTAEYAKVEWPEMLEILVH